MASCDRLDQSDMDYSGDLPKNVRIRRLVSLDPERFHTDMRHVDVGEGVQVSAISWGGPVEVETEPLLDRYLVTVPLSGEITVDSGSEVTIADTGHTVIVDPEHETVQRWSADASAIWLHLARDAVEDEARHLARAGEHSITLPERRPVHLDPSIDVTHGAGQAWRTALQRLIDLLDDYHPMDSIPPHRLKVHRREVINDLLRAAWRQ